MKLNKINLSKSNILVFEYADIKDKPLGEVSEYFSKQKVESLLITKNKKPYYLLTAIDIIDALVSHSDKMLLFEFIDKNPKSVITVNENETLFEAYRLMRSYKIHHLVVVDDEGNFKYMIDYYDFTTYLTEIAIKDEMTGLYNKRFFEFIIDKYKNEDLDMGIIFIDLNNFKQLNDTYGHLFGDKVIIEVAKIIKSSIRDVDYAFRFGGDEYVVVLFASNEILEKVAKRIENKINSTELEDIKFSAAVGYAHYPTDSDSLEKVIDIADKRMYEEKERIKSLKS